MSPATLRRYRAERLLRRDFEASRATVLRAVRARLGAAGGRLDDGDLEACYAAAWQGLYAAALEGREIANPRAWLVVVTYRRAVEEHRARLRRESPLAPPAGGEGLEEDLDDRMRLRQLLEGMRGRLGAREREAAALCYLQGYSRAEAARRMGISEARMRKLMEGRGRGQLGVAAKVGALVETIRDGAFCEEHASLMRALAYGVLDPDGERHRLAVAHRRNCPACRRYVASLRGLAIALPPVLGPSRAACGGLSRLIGLGHGGSRGGASRILAGRGWLSRPVAPGGRSAGAVGASAAGAGGAAGGSWVMGAGLGAKLAVGCLLAIGIGAGCATLGGAPREHGARAPIGATPRPRDGCPCSPASSAASRPWGLGVAGPGAAGPRGAGASALGGSEREFGPEQATVPAVRGTGSYQLAPVASRSSVPPAAAPRATTAAEAGGAAAPIPAGEPSSAEREFSPG